MAEAKVKEAEVAVEEKEGCCCECEGETAKVAEEQKAKEQCREEKSSCCG